jgi:L-asparaginase II
MTQVLLARSRGFALEAEHIGSVAMVRADGSVVFASGDIRRPFYPRSSVKLIQAIPFLERAADFFACTTSDITLAASSHGGEPESISLLRMWLDRLSLSLDDLACGPDNPLNPRVAQNFEQTGTQPSALHNNNSGKHLAVLSTCIYKGEEIKHYCELSHPAQKRLINVVKDYCKLDYDLTDFAIDNCGMITFPLSAYHLALGMAQMSLEYTQQPEGVARRLFDSIATQPAYLAGPKRLVTQVIQACKTITIVKGGSEGVYSAALPEHAIGIALKINDGSGEAASAVMIRILEGLGLLSSETAISLLQRINLMQNRWAPARSAHLSFPALHGLPSLVQSPPALPSLGPHSTLKNSRSFIDQQGRQLFDLPFRYGHIRHNGKNDTLVAAFKERAEKAVEETSTYLNVAPPQDIVIQLVGRHVRSMTYWEEKRIRLSLLKLPRADALHHELTHLLLGPSAMLQGILTEGMAVHAQSLLAGLSDQSFPTFGQDLHMLAAQTMRQSGIALPQEASLFRPDSHADDMQEDRTRAYLAAGSFVRHLIDEWGLDAVLACYRNSESRADHYSERLDAGEQTWQKQLQNTMDF